MKRKFFTINFFVLIWAIMGSASFCFASSTDGTIDSTYRYAWSENVGWIDFGSAGGNVHITDSGLSGYAYGENIGWIVLDSVSNTSSGTLSGYAWGENVGWVDFSNVTIGSDGVFSGYAYGENIGNIVFGTGSNKVLTDWRPESERTSSTPVSRGRSGQRISLYAFIPNACTSGALFDVNTGKPCEIKPLPTALFSRDLKFGMIDAEVRRLQQYLNANGVTVSKSGAGSIGYETSYFGPATRSALAKFQKIHKISPAVGYFGPITRGFINNQK